MKEIAENPLQETSPLLPFNEVICESPGRIQYPFAIHNGKISRLPKRPHRSAKEV